MMKGLRIVGVLAMAFAIAHCGDSDIHVSTDSRVDPTPGTFTGTLSGGGGSIRLEVGSIDEIAFDCKNERIEKIFPPPGEKINNDGSFDVAFTDGGREFHVLGTFEDNNNIVDGKIEDEDKECNASYVATRGNVLPTPARTPTGVQQTATPPPGVTATVTPGGETPSGETPSGATKTATPTPTARPCPIGVEVLGTAGDDKILDTGWTGIAHNQPVIQDSKLTFNLSECASSVRPCGQCTTGGPIPNANAGHGDIDSQRCTNDTSIKCTTDAPCTTGGGKCAFFFGAPLPLSAGGVSTCVSNQIDGPISGTANVESGNFASQIKLKASVFLVDDVSRPCPLCSDTGGVNDGVEGGTCSTGPRQGEACDANGRSTLFGRTSLDCPSALSTRAAVLDIDLTGSSGTITRTLSASSDNCTSVAGQGKKCFCPPGPGGSGASTQPNACTDDTTTGVDETLCAPVPGSPNEGKCLAGPTDQNCQHDTFIGCSSNTDCAPGDPCVPVPRPCYLDNGIIGGSVSAVGMADVPVNGESDPVFASLFCVPRTAKAAIDTVAGLPGLGRITLPLHAKEILPTP